ncbi:MAG: ATPase [Bacteroidetes bacterium]|nr:ATPase [Bacteroidota bacterium]
MNNAPFVFGKLATSVDFTDRETEVSQLTSNFKALVNTIILSPRRWGKTSLINRVSELLKLEDPNLKICHIDLFNVRTEVDFYILLATEILKATSTRWEEIIQNAKEFLVRFMPKISFSPDNQSEISFGISWDEMKKNPDEILDLAETIAIKRGLKIVIGIDEFQSIGDFENSLAFQKKLRSHWQRHTHVSYCLYGSKRHMLLDVFSNPSMPFYKFGDLILLEKISTKNWVHFIQRRFAETGKLIGGEEATLISNLAGNHSYYVQQLAQQSWFRTEKECAKSIVYESHEGIVDQLSLLFINITESLSTMQLNFLKAILSDEKQLSAQSTLQKYKLGTSANIGRLKQSLLAREIIDINADRIDFQDPIYKHWLKTRYFEKIQNLQ